MKNSIHMDNTDSKTAEMNSVKEEAIRLPDESLKKVNGGAGIMSYIVDLFGEADIEEASEGNAGSRPFLKERSVIFQITIEKYGSGLRSIFFCVNAHSLEDAERFSCVCR